MEIEEERGRQMERERERESDRDRGESVRDRGADLGSGGRPNSEVGEREGRSLSLSFSLSPST